MIHTIEPLSKASLLNVPASFHQGRGVVANMFSLFFGLALVLLDFLILETQGKALFIRRSRIFLRFIVISDMYKNVGNRFWCSNLNLFSRAFSPFCFSNHTRVIVDAKTKRSAQLSCFLRKFSAHVQSDILSSYSINLFFFTIRR